MIQHLESLDHENLVDVYRHWAGDIGVPTRDGALVRRELARLMSDQARVMQRFRELPPRCRDFLAWIIAKPGYAVPLSVFDEEGDDLPVKPVEAESVAMHLKRRGFLVETQDRSWMHYNEPLYRVPGELGDVLRSRLAGGRRSLESQLSLRSYVRGLDRKTLAARLRDLGLAPALAEDRSSLVGELAKAEAVDNALARIPDPQISEAVTRCLYEHGGILEAGHLARLGYAVDDPARWRRVLEERLLGTLLDGDLSDVGLRFSEGSLVIFLELARSVLHAGVEVVPEEEPEPPADVLADLSAIRTYLAHHSVRVTRDGSLYRTTRRKMSAEVLSPGARPMPQDEALSLLLQFAGEAELARRDRDGRLRVASDWNDFDARGPVERTDLLLTYVQNDLRGTEGEFHQARLRKHLLAVLRDAGPGRWLNLRALAMLARNRYLSAMDRPLLAERFQKRYKYAPVPPLAGPAALVKELAAFGGRALAAVGVVELLDEEDLPRAVRLTRLGAAVLGLPVEDVLEDGQGALIVTADFEVILFPEAGGIELVHQVGRFARREKADYSLHYRITQRSVQEAVAQGMDAGDILEVLRENGRHEVPQNVSASVSSWAQAVRILEARRTLVLKAPDKESLDAALKVRDVRAVCGERLNDTTVELTEDPSNARIAEALRSSGFFLR